MGRGTDDYILVVSQMTVWIREYSEGFSIAARLEMRKRLAEVGTLRVLFYRPVWLQTCPLQRSFHVQSGILALKLNTTEECSGSRPLSTRLMISCSYRFKKKKKTITVKTQTYLVGFHAVQTHILLLI